MKPTYEKLESKLNSMEEAFIIINNDRNSILEIKQKLNKKITELEKELTWKIKHRRVFHPSAFLYYLKQIRGDPPTDVKQECPFDN